jgi:hypothetical protein
MAHREDEFYETLAEFVFILVPLIVIAVVSFFTGGGGLSFLRRLVFSSEWAFGSAILFGQTILKIVEGALRAELVKAGRVVFTISLVLVFGLIPSLTVLALIIQEEEQLIYQSSFHASNLLLHVSQTILFVAASAVFIGVGSIGRRIAGS